MIPINICTTSYLFFSRNEHVCRVYFSPWHRCYHIHTRDLLFIFFQTPFDNWPVELYRLRTLSSVNIISSILYNVFTSSKVHTFVLIPVNILLGRHIPWSSYALLCINRSTLRAVYVPNVLNFLFSKHVNSFIKYHYLVQIYFTC